jgi:hypothetical protein
MKSSFRVFSRISRANFLTFQYRESPIEQANACHTCGFEPTRIAKTRLGV